MASCHYGSDVKQVPVIGYGVGSTEGSKFSRVELKNRRVVST
jgi:hypothetical protein